MSEKLHDMEVGFGIAPLERMIEPGVGARPKECWLAQNRTLCDIVASKLALEWSPEQITIG